MTIPILTLDPDWEITESYEFLPKEVRLGDNYKQMLNPSTVSLIKTWNVRKTGLLRSEANELIANLKLFSGVVGFSWTPGQGVPSDVYLCDEWLATPIGGGNLGGEGVGTYWVVEATFRQDPKSQCLEYVSEMPLTQISSVLAGMKTYITEYTNNRGATSKPHLITSDNISSTLRYFLKYGFNSPNVNKYLYANYGVSDYQTQVRFLLGCILARVITGDSSWWNDIGTRVRDALELYHRLGFNNSTALPTTYYNVQEAIAELGETSQSNRNYYGTFNIPITFSSGVATIPSGNNGNRVARVYRVYKETASLAAPIIYSPLRDLQKDSTDELEIDYWVSNFEMKGQNYRFKPDSFGEENGGFLDTTNETVGLIKLKTNFTGNALVTYSFYKSAVNINTATRFASHPIRRNNLTNESETFISSLFDAYLAAVELDNLTGSNTYLNTINATLTTLLGSSGDGANSAFFFRREEGFTGLPLPYVGQSLYSENSSATISRVNTGLTFSSQINHCARVVASTADYDDFGRWGLKNEGIDFKIVPTSRFEIEYFAYKGRNDRRLLRVFCNIENLFDNDSQTKDEYETWLVADSITNLAIPGTPIFSGGQCNNVRYRINFNATEYLNTLTCTLAGNTTSSSFTSAWGPIQDFRTIAGSTAGGCQGFTQVQVFARPSSGGTPQWLTIISSTGANVFHTWNLTGIERFDGLPDTCGDPPQPPDESAAILNTISLSYLDFKKWNTNKLIWWVGHPAHNYLTTVDSQRPNIIGFHAVYDASDVLFFSSVKQYVNIGYANVLEVVDGINTYPTVVQIQTNYFTDESRRNVRGGWRLVNVDTVPRNRMRIKYRLTGLPVKVFFVQGTRTWEYAIPVSTSFTVLDINFRDLIWSGLNNPSKTRKEFDVSQFVDDWFFIAEQGASFMEIQWISPNEANDPEPMPKRCRIFGFGVETWDYDSPRFGVGNVQVTNVDSPKAYTPGIVNKFAQGTNNVVEAFIGSPTPAYQSLYHWILGGNLTNADNVADFLLASQDAYAKANPDFEGAFSPILYDKDYKRPEAYLKGYEKWSFKSTSIEENLEYAGEQYLALERTARAWFQDPTFEKAGIITMRFLAMIDEFMKKNNTNRVPTKINASTVTVTNPDPYCASLVLRAALYANLAKGDPQITFRVMRKCYNFLMEEYQSNTNNTNFGSFTNSQDGFQFNSISYKHNYGKWLAEELITFAELLKYRSDVVYPPCKTNLT